MKTAFVVSLIVLTAFLSPNVHCLNNGLALTPPMGWLTWTRFLCNTDCKNDPQNCISERLIKDHVDRMAEDGFRDAGYEYVIIDDCWLASARDKDGKLQADSSRFPSGIAALADYAHSRGLKFGIYQDVGNKTCVGFPGSYGHYDVDAQTFADWGVDYLKFDGCYAEPKDFDTLYPSMTKSLQKTNRPIVYSCEWPLYQAQNGIKPDYKKIADSCNLWRNYGDIRDSWASVTSILDYQASVQGDTVPVSGPGAWTDPDMLVVGNFGLSLDQSKLHMALWAVLAAPLIMSNDLRDLRPEHKDILTNPYVIAVNQDKLGIMGKRVYAESSLEIWVRPIGPASSADKNSLSAAIAVLSRRDQGSATSLSKKLSDIGLNNPTGYNITDLFNGNKPIGEFQPSSVLTVKVNPNGVVFLKATVKDSSAKSR